MPTNKSEESALKVTEQPAIASRLGHRPRQVIEKHPADFCPIWGTRALQGGKGTLRNTDGVDSVSSYHI